MLGTMESIGLKTECILRLMHRLYNRIHIRVYIKANASYLLRDFLCDQVIRCVNIYVLILC